MECKSNFLFEILPGDFITRLILGKIGHFQEQMNGVISNFMSGVAYSVQGHFILSFKFANAMRPIDLN